MVRTKVSIVVPVLNEIKTLPVFLENLAKITNQNQIDFQVVFVDNGSFDGSYEFLASYIERNCVQGTNSIYQIVHQFKRGKGRAVRKGLELTSGDFVVIIDADNEYELSDFHELFGAIYNSNVDLVLGTRYSGGPMRKILNQPLTSWYFNSGHSFFTWYFNLLFRTNLTDPATMWKFMRGDIVRDLKLTGNSFNLDFEIVAGFAKLQKVIIEVPVQYVARSKSDGKKIRLFTDPIIWMASFLKYSMRSANNFLKSPYSNQRGCSIHAPEL